MNKFNKYYKELESLVPSFNVMSAKKFINICSNDKYIKFRIFDDFFYPPMVKISGRHRLANTDFKMNGLILKESFISTVSVGFWNMCLENPNKYIFYINGYYETANYGVFCGLPRLQTLINSFNNNFTETQYKFAQCYDLSVITLRSLNFDSRERFIDTYGHLVVK